MSAKVAAASRARQGAAISHARRSAEQRAVVHRALEGARASGIPKSQVELAAATGMRVEAFRKHERAYLRDIKAELLAHVVQDEEAFQAWIALYRCFATRIKAAQEARALQRRLVRLSIESLDRSGKPITYNVVDTLTGLGSQRVAAELRAWEVETGRKRARASVWQPVTLATVLPLIDPALHHMPLTFLDDPRAHRSLSVTSLRMISGLAPPKLRNTAFFCLTIAEAGHSTDRCFFGALAGFLPTLGLADIDALDPDTFYPAFHGGQVLPEVTAPSRVHSLQVYFRLLRRQQIYFERLTPEQARGLAPFRLQEVTSATFWHRSLLYKRVDDERRKRRKAATAAVHDKFYLFRNIAERRVNQLVRLRQAFRDACDRARRHPGTSFPMTFAYTEEVVTPAGSARTVSHRFRLWDGRTLRCLHAPVAPKQYYAAREAAAMTGYDRGADSLFVSYEGASAECETVEQAGFWFADLVRSGGLNYDPDPAFLAAHGYAAARAIQF